MAIALQLLPSNPTIEIGSTQKFTATITGAPVDAVTTYVWTVDGVVQTSTQSSIDYLGDTLGSKVIKVVATTEVQDAEDDVQEASTSVNVTKKKMIVTAKAITNDATVFIDDTMDFTVTLTGAPAGSTITYAWSTGQTTAIFSETATTAGTYETKCTVTVKAADYEDTTVESNTVTVLVNKKTLPKIELKVSGPSTSKKDESFTLKAESTGIPSGVTSKYIWNTGEESDTLTTSLSTIGVTSFTVKLTITSSDYEDGEFEVTHQVEVKDIEVPEECPIVYVHPLPHRGTAYIWCGWWVMDAIQALTNEGKDWKSATQDDTPYYCHLAVLAKMIADYPEVDVQESRHGRIVHRSALDVGIIY